MADDRASWSAAPWAAAAAGLEPLLGGPARFELRFALRDGEAAVRVLAPRGPVAPRHAEAPDVAAAWSATARCGAATGLLLATVAPADPEAAHALLEAATVRHAAARLERLTAQSAAVAYDVLETITHRLRTDVSSLQAVAEGALTGTFGGEEAGDIAGEVRAVGEESQRRLTGVRDVMAVLDPEAPRRPEPLVAALRDALGDGAPPLPVAGAAPGEEPLALVPGPGWTACAAGLARALRADRRLGADRAELTIAAHPCGWRVIAGAPGADAGPAPWTLQQLDALAQPGQLLAAAGGAVSARRTDHDGLRILWSIPAAPSA